MNRYQDSSTDLSGFLDGLRARNLATIERDTALPVSELQVRLHLLQMSLALSPDTERLVLPTRDLFNLLRDPEKTIVERLEHVGARLRDMILADGRQIVSKTDIRVHVDSLVRRFVEAADLAHQDRLIDTALSLGEAWKSLLNGAASPATDLTAR